MSTWEPVATLELPADVFYDVVALLEKVGGEWLGTWTFVFREIALVPDDYDGKGRS